MRASIHTDIERGEIVNEGLEIHLYKDTGAQSILSTTGLFATRYIVFITQRAVAESLNKRLQDAVLNVEQSAVSSRTGVLAFNILQIK